MDTFKIFQRVVRFIGDRMMVGTVVSVNYGCLGIRWEDGTRTEVLASKVVR